MEDAARARSFFGDVFGTDPYRKEWSRQRKQVLKQYKMQERSMRKGWHREDQHLEREFAKMERRHGANFAARQRKELQRERNKALENMKYEKSDAIRGISRNIRDYRDTSLSA